MSRTPKTIHVAGNPLGELLTAQLFVGTKLGLWRKDAPHTRKPTKAGRPEGYKPALGTHLGPSHTHYYQRGGRWRALSIQAEMRDKPDWDRFVAALLAFAIGADQRLARRADDRGSRGTVEAATKPHR